jgi:anthranilate/para-aminobenzoate synthase component I
MEDIDIDVQVVDDTGIDPATVFAKLRRYTPGRPSFLFETLDRSHPEGRYSVVGYRVRRGATLPPGVDAYSVLAENMREDPQPDTFAEALARCSVGYLSPGVSWLANRVPVFDDEGASGHLAVGAAIMLFDHQENTITVAAPNRGDQVERLLYELDKGDDIPDVAAVTEGASPETVKRQVDADRLRRRLKRAKIFLDDRVTELVLSQQYICPAQSDPFEVYRALRSTDHGAAHGYYVDFGETPMSPPLRLFGVTNDVLAQTLRGDDGPDFGQRLHSALPHRSATGKDAAKAAKLLRKIEDSARPIWGGAVGYACPGGEAKYLLTDRAIYMEHDAYFVPCGAAVTKDVTDVAEVEAAMEAAAKPALAAIAAAASGKEAT